MDDLTIEEAAQFRGVSKETIRRQIRKGMLQAHKAIGRYGEQWLIPRSQLDNPQPFQQTTNVKELQKMLEQALDDTVRRVVKEEVCQRLDEIQLRQERQEQRMNEHYQAVDSILRERVQASKSSFWKRLFQY